MSSPLDFGSIFGSPSLSPLSSPVLPPRHTEAGPSRYALRTRTSESPNTNITSVMDSSPPSGSSRRRNLQALDIQQGDQRGLSQILSDRRRTQGENDDEREMRNNPVISGIRPPRARRALPDHDRRSTIVEVGDDDSDDDDIVFTGENRNPNPPLPPHPRYLNLRQHARGNQGQDGVIDPRRPSPNRFRRAMDDLDAILARTRNAHDAIMNEQEHERRRQIMSPPVQPPEIRPRIGLGGGGLFRRGQLAEQPNHLANPHAVHPTDRPIVFVNDRRPMFNGNVDDLDLNNPDPMERLRALLGGNLPDRRLAHALAGGILGGAGAAGQEDVQSILSKVELPKYPKPTNKNFTMNFDLESIVSNEPIELDDEGAVIVKKKRKSRLICSNCSNPLLISSAYKSTDDKLWSLRCGHLLDQRCLNQLQTPTTVKELASVIKDADHDLLNAGENDGPPKKRRKNASRKAKAKVERKEPDEYTFNCPVEGCGRPHKSVDIGGTWIAKEKEGALAAYA